MPDISPAAEKAISMLTSAGYDARLVGGCVRDILMGITPHDWDIATSSEPHETARVFEGCRTIMTGVKHGTVTVIIDGEPLEITTFRIDGDYSDNRRPDSVSFSGNLEDDLARRDFTMNAVAYSPARGYSDPFGGKADIKSGVIRCVGEPDKRFREDALRILRALRFSSVLGFDIELETAEAIHKNRKLLKNISAERIRSELTKLLCGKNAEKILLDYADVLAVPIPELSPMFGFEQRNKHHCFDVWRHTVAAVANTPPDPILRWTALLHDIGKPSRFTVGKDGAGHFYGHAASSVSISEPILNRLRFDNKSKKRILLLVEYHDIFITMTADKLKKWLSKIGPEAMFQLLSVARADNMGQAPAFRHYQERYDELERELSRILESGECCSLDGLDINGDDLKALGFRGRGIGNALSFLLRAVTEEGLENKKDALIAHLEKSDLK